MSYGQDMITAPMNSHSCGYLHEAYTSLSLSKFHSHGEEVHKVLTVPEEFLTVSG